MLEYMISDYGEIFFTSMLRHRKVVLLELIAFKCFNLQYSTKHRLAPSACGQSENALGSFE